MPHEAVELLSRYIKIDTTNPPGNEHKGARFFAEIFDKENIAYKTYEPEEGRTSICARISGTGKEEPLILLNHIDVVLAEKEQWSFDPFGGEIKDGYIHGRGTLDMKGQGIVELLTFLKIARNKEKPNRDIVFLAVADEEAGGEKGAEYLLKNHAEEFKAGLVLNEGGYGIHDFTPDRPVMFISTAEKAPNWLKISCQGPPGHGSVPHDENALERLIQGLNRLTAMENPIIITPVITEYFKKLVSIWNFLKPYIKDNKEETLIQCLTESGLAGVPQISAMIRNTISINVISAGSKTNVIPSTAEAEVDVRLLPGQDSEKFIDAVRAQIADESIKVEFITCNKALSSPIETEDFAIIEKTLQKNFPDAIIVPSVLFGSSDSRFFREKGINAYGVMPILAAMADFKSVHGIDEKISEANMIRATEVYLDIVKALCQLS